jgi:16S rRNA (adenine1518-N6/adenine1519-N6)-dimethyltransferase
LAYICGMTDRVRAKKYLGQHFLKQESIAARIAATIQDSSHKKVLEIGPGMGVLTKYLLQLPEKDIWVSEIDHESVAYLRAHFPILSPQIIEGDFLKMDLPVYFQQQPIIIIGNFPYNISSQILFKVWENYQMVPLFAGMFQKEVAQRVASPPGSKTYGILSVLLQQLYDIQYLFSVPPEAFQPPPKVQSGVLIMEKKVDVDATINPAHFKRVVKMAFNQRRKTLRNALKGLTFDSALVPDGIMNQRAEQLHYSEFELLTKALQT